MKQYFSLQNLFMFAVIVVLPVCVAFYSINNMIEEQYLAKRETIAHELRHQIADLGGTSSEDYQIEDIQAEVEKLEPDSSEINMAVVMYCLAAIRFFRTKTQKEIQFIAYELAMRWNQWIKYWEDAKYHIDSIPWKEFSWYEFLSYMYVAWQILKPEADLWLDYSREYELAKQLDSKK